MRIATWNVNSARTRADRMVDLLTRHDIDVLAVQETKCTDAQFPTNKFEDVGYEVAHVGYNQWNGVAIISRVGLEDVADHFPGQPGFAKDQQKPQQIEARAIGATCGGIRIWSLYVPNGREIADPHFDYKLRWLETLRRYALRCQESDPDQCAVYLGDFNIAPRDEDVWDMAAFDGKTHVTEPERAAFQALIESGLDEVSRQFTQDVRFTYWDYKAGRFHRGEGMRIDFQLATRPLAAHATNGFVDIDERATKGSSDHAALIVDYALDVDSVR